MKKLLVLTLLLILPACMGTHSYLDEGYKQIHIWDNSLLNTSSKLTVYEKCDEEGNNCKLLGMYHSDTTGFLPSIGGQALQGVAIGVGLANQDHDSDSVGGSNIIDNSCQGNCGQGNQGGGPR